MHVRMVRSKMTSESVADVDAAAQRYSRRSERLGPRGRATRLTSCVSSMLRWQPPQQPWQSSLGGKASVY
jgi:hypothetical protein